MRAHYRPAIPMRIAIDFTLAPVRAVIDQLIEHGTVDLAMLPDGASIPVFIRAGRAEPLIPALEGLIEWYDAAVEDRGLTGPLCALVSALQERTEFSSSMLAELQALLPRLKQAGRNVPSAVARAIVDRQMAVAGQEAAQS